MVGAQGQAKWAKVAKKTSTYDVTHKNRIPQAKNFFFKCRLEDLPCLETFTGSVEHTRPANSRTKPRAFRRFFSENPRNQPDAKELNEMI